MGGYGSGRHSDNTARETDFAAVSIGQAAGALRATGGALVLSCTFRGESVACPVAVEWTPCHYGGARPWFVCPECGRRSGRLYAGRRFACRLCRGFRYESQYSPAACGLANRIRRLQGKLQGGRLQWRTRRRLEAQLAVEWARLGAIVGHLEARLAGAEMALNRK